MPNHVTFIRKKKLLWWVFISTGSDTRMVLHGDKCIIHQKIFTAAYKLLKKIPNKEQKDFHYFQKCYISCKYPWEMSWVRTIALTCGVATILSVKTSPSGSLPSLSNSFWVIKLSMSMPLESSRCFSLRCCDSAHSQFIELHTPISL